MNTLSSRINFSTKDPGITAAIRIDPRRDLNYYETMCFFIANNNVNVEGVDQSDYDSAAMQIQGFAKASADEKDDFFWFWIYID